MKKKVLISSLATIALCLCLVAGSTFALFTETTTVNIAVTAGDLDVTAAIVEDSLKGHSLGGTFPTDGDTTAEFANGGTASFTNNVLGISKMTPGDAVQFNVTVTNSGDVAAMYTVEHSFVLPTNEETDPDSDAYKERAAAVAAATKLSTLLEITVTANNNEFTGTTTYAALGDPGATTTFTVTVVFPNGDADVDNLCQGAEDLGIVFTVTAVQENGVENGELIDDRY